jgi:general stress protein 26
MQNSSDLNREQSVQKLGELISGIRVAMLTTLSPDGSFHSRPMGTQSTDFDGELWFFTHLDSPKSHEVRKDSHVALSYCDPEENRYVAVCGKGEIIQDRAKAEKLWTPLFRAWFPKGIEDPQLALLKVKVEKAEYWDFASGKMVQLVGFIKALTTGRTVEPSPDQHRKLDLTG